jgi:hypothetical protein
MRMAALSTEGILARLGELKPQILRKFRVKEIQLFGSYVRGEKNFRGDIDILADFEDGADLLDLVGLPIFLEDEFKQKVDVVPKRALREELQESILSEAVAV